MHLGAAQNDGADGLAFAKQGALSSVRQPSTADMARPVGNSRPSSESTSCTCTGRRSAMARPEIELRSLAQRRRFIGIGP
jgi:hypothetical protein